MSSSFNPRCSILRADIPPDYHSSYRYPSEAEAHLEEHFETSAPTHTIDSDIKMNPPDLGAIGAANNFADSTTAAVSSAINSAQDAAFSVTQRNAGSSTSISSNTTSKPASVGADWSFASREKGPSPLGSILFVALRAADVYLQYALVRYEILPRAIGYLPIGMHFHNLRS